MICLEFDTHILSGQLAPSSIAMYERDFGAYLAFAGEFDRAMQPATLAQWRAHLTQATQMSPNTINRTAAMKQRIKDNARVRIEPEEMREVCDSPDLNHLLGLRDSALLATLASGGLRVSELASLTTNQIKRKKGGYIVLIRGKNDVDYRDAPLGREAYDHIRVWLSARPVQSEYVFTAFDGRGERATARPLSSVAVWKIVRKYSQGAGLEAVKPHDFRRFVGTQLVRKDIRMAQKALDHKRIETTARHYVLDELEPGLTDNLY